MCPFKFQFLTFRRELASVPRDPLKNHRILWAPRLRMSEQMNSMNVHRSQSIFYPPSFTPEPSHTSLHRHRFLIGARSLLSCVPERGGCGKRWGVKDIPEAVGVRAAQFGNHFGSNQFRKNGPEFQSKEQTVRRLGHPSQSIFYPPSFTSEPSHASLHRHRFSHRARSLLSCVPGRGGCGKRWGVKDIQEAVEVRVQDGQAGQARRRSTKNSLRLQPVPVYQFC
jgi:hypothetical protein